MTKSGYTVRCKNSSSGKCNYSVTYPSGRIVPMTKDEILRKKIRTESQLEVYEKRAKTRYIKAGLKDGKKQTVHRKIDASCGENNVYKIECILSDDKTCKLYCNGKETNRTKLYAMVSESPHRMAAMKRRITRATQVAQDRMARQGAAALTGTKVRKAPATAYSKLNPYMKFVKGAYDSEQVDTSLPISERGKQLGKLYQSLPDESKTALKAVKSESSGAELVTNLLTGVQPSLKTPVVSSKKTDATVKACPANRTAVLAKITELDNMNMNLLRMYNEIDQMYSARCLSNKTAAELFAIRKDGKYVFFQKMTTELFQKQLLPCIVELEKTGDINLKCLQKLRTNYEHVIPRYVNLKKIIQEQCPLDSQSRTVSSFSIMSILKSTLDGTKVALTAVLYSIRAFATMVSCGVKSVLQYLWGLKFVALVLVLALLGGKAITQKGALEYITQGGLQFIFVVFHSIQQLCSLKSAAMVYVALYMAISQISTRLNLPKTVMRQFQKVTQSRLYSLFMPLSSIICILNSFVPGWASSIGTLANSMGLAAQTKLTNYLNSTPLQSVTDITSGPSSNQTSPANFTAPSNQTSPANFTAPSNQTSPATFTAPSNQTSPATFTAPSNQTSPATFTAPSNQTSPATFTAPSNQTSPATFTAPSNQTSPANFTATFTAPSNQTSPATFTAPSNQTSPATFTAPPANLTTSANATDIPISTLNSLLKQAPQEVKDEAVAIYTNVTGSVAVDTGKPETASVAVSVMPETQVKQMIQTTLPDVELVTTEVLQESLDEGLVAQGPLQNWETTYFDKIVGHPKFTKGESLKGRSDDDYGNVPIVSSEPGGNPSAQGPPQWFYSDFYKDDKRLGDFVKRGGKPVTTVMAGRTYIEEAPVHPLEHNLLPYRDFDLHAQDMKNLVLGDPDPKIVRARWNALLQQYDANPDYKNIADSTGLLETLRPMVDKIDPIPKKGWFS